MKITLPNNDEGRSAMLRSTVDAGQSDFEAGRTLLSAETLEQAGQMHAHFYGEQLTLAAATAERHAAMVALDEAIHVLSTECRDLCRTLRRRVNRKLAPSDMLKYYGLPQKGRMTFPKARATWVEFGARLQRGDDRAQAAGHPGASNRYLLDDAFLTAEHALSLFTAADKALTVAQEQFASTRKEVDALLREIRRELRFALHHKHDAQKHTFLHAYGLLRNHSEEAAKRDPEQVPAEMAPAASEPEADAGSATQGDLNPQVEDAEKASNVPLLYATANGHGTVSTNGNGAMPAA